MPNAKSANLYRGGEFIRAASGGTKDLMTVLLEPDRLYTEAEVAGILEAHLRKEVGK